MTIIDKLLRHIDLALPAECPLCHRWVRKGSMRQAQTTYDKWVDICSPCFFGLYPNRLSLR